MRRTTTVDDGVGNRVSTVDADLLVILADLDRMRGAGTYVPIETHPDAWADLRALGHVAVGVAAGVPVVAITPRGCEVARHLRELGFGEARRRHA